MKVTGYADSDTGSAAWNKQLSEDRANNVANELVKLGVNKNNLIISGMGGVNTLTPPAISQYIGGKKGYKKNKYKYDDRTVRLVEENWKFALDQWGYSI